MAMEHVQDLLQLVLDIIQDIDNSITFCKLGKMHPSIINPKALHQALRDLTYFYKDRLPNFEGDSLWELLTHIRLRCFIGTEEIVYFLDIPILRSDNFELMVLQSVPAVHPSGYFTIVPAARLALKSQTSETIILVKSSCEPGMHFALCPNNQELISDHKCEYDILRHGSNAQCDIISLSINHTHIEFIEEARQYILIFPHEDEVQITTNNKVEDRTIRGIFLLSPDNSTVKFRNHTLVAPSTISSYTPTLFLHSSVNLNFTKRQSAVIKLKNLKMLSQPPRLTLPTTDVIIQLATPSIWTMILYVLILAVIVNAIYRYCKHVRTLNLNQSAS